MAVKGDGEGGLAVIGTGMVLLIRVMCHHIRL